MLLELRELQSTLGIGFVYVTHDQTEALMASDQVVVLHQGVVQQCGTPRELYGSPATRFVAEFLGDSSMIEGHCVGVQGGNATVESAGHQDFAKPAQSCRERASLSASDQTPEQLQQMMAFMKTKYRREFSIAAMANLPAREVRPGKFINFRNGGSVDLVRSKEYSPAVDPDRCIAFP